MYLLRLWIVIMFACGLFSDSKSTHYDVHDLVSTIWILGPRFDVHDLVSSICVLDLGFPQSKKKSACKTSIILKELGK